MTESSGVSWRNVRQWAGVLIGPTVFLFDLVARYSLVSISRAARKPPLRVVSALALVATVGALSGALREMRLTSAPENEARAFGARFLAVLGVVMSSFFLLVIAANALPAFFLDAED
jgi:hypothetical protein